MFSRQMLAPKSTCANTMEFRAILLPFILDMCLLLFPFLTYWYESSGLLMMKIWYRTPNILPTYAKWFPASFSSGIWSFRDKQLQHCKAFWHLETAQCFSLTHLVNAPTMFFFSFSSHCSDNTSSLGCSQLTNVTESEKE